MNAPIHRRRFLSAAPGTASLAGVGAPLAGGATAQGRVSCSGDTRVRREKILPMG